MRSIDAELQKAWVNSKFYKSGDSTAISGSNVRGRPGLAPTSRLIDPEGFEAYQDVFPSTSRSLRIQIQLGGTYHMLKNVARTPTKPKTKVIRQKKLVSKKKPVRKATADKPAPKSAPQYVMDIESSDGEDFGKGRPIGASAQAHAQAEYEREDEESDYVEDDSDFQDGDYEEEEWSFNCVCGSDDKVLPDI